MKCMGFILVLPALYCVAAEILDNKLLFKFEDVRQDGIISDSCQEALQLYVDNLQSEKDTWALRMLDATSKIPVGLLSLNSGELGQFSQCMSIESEDGLIQPKYCLGMLPLTAISGAVENRTVLLYEQPIERLVQFQHIRHASRSITNILSRENDGDDQTTSTTGIHWAICIPSNCSNEDVGEIFSKILGSKSATCQTKKDLSPSLTGGAIAAIVILSIFAFLLVSSTVLDLYYRHIHKEPSHIGLIAFSVYSNGEKLFRINHNSNELTCLNGIRLLSMLWVIIGHVYSMNIEMPLFNYSDVSNWINTLRSMAIVSGTLSVDTFFLLSGLLVVYSYLKAKHHGVKFNIFQFYIHRYLRLTPALAVGVLVTAHLLKYIGSGPLWSTVSSLEGACQKYWWTTLLYVQNYVNKDAMCLPQSWYLSADMQLYIISPLILFPLWKYPKIGLGIVGAGILTFIIVPFTIAYVNELPGLVTNFYFQAKIQEYMKICYIKTHARAAPWFIGLLIGYILAKIKFEGHKHITINKIIIVVVWMISIAVVLTCVYGGHSTLRGADFDKWGNSLYIALLRPAWSICLAWVIFACVTGYGGPINWLLSLPIYQVLNRFTYSVYLIHYPLLYICGYMRKTGVYFDEFSMAYSFWGIIMFSFGLSIIWVLAFESPIVVLEKIIFSGPKRTNKENGRKNGLPA